MSVVAETILYHIGGRRFQQATKARFFGTTSSLEIRVPPGVASGGVLHVTVTLERATDAYVIETYRAGETPLSDMRRVEKREEIFLEELREVLADMTGLSALGVTHAAH